MSSATNAGSQFAQHAVTDGQLASFIGIGSSVCHAVLVAVAGLGRRRFSVKSRFRVPRRARRRQLKNAVP